jgi:NOL1/NOP2/fmu family ribosome biogenesis protein
LSFLEDRFGIVKAVFDDFLLLKKNKSWWLLRQSKDIRQASLLKVSTVGLKAFQIIGQYIKPTTRLIQIFGRHAKRAVFEVQPEDIKKMAMGMQFHTNVVLDDGYVILSFMGVIIGLGLLIDGSVSSQMPRRDLVSFVE